MASSYPEGNHSDERIVGLQIRLRTAEQISAIYQQTISDLQQALTEAQQQLEYQASEIEDAKTFIASLQDALRAKEAELTGVYEQLQEQSADIDATKSFAASLQDTLPTAQQESLLPPSVTSLQPEPNEANRAENLTTSLVRIDAGQHRTPLLIAQTDQTSSAIPIGATIVCTIVSKNYLASARVLIESVMQNQDDVYPVVLLVDELDGFIDPSSEPYELLLASQLNIPNWHHFTMKYDILELNTAVKPYLIETLFDRYSAQKVIYFDPDIAVYERLDELCNLLDRYTAVVTPHILTPTQRVPESNELLFLRVGTFNLGFFAISRRGEWRELLQWWQSKLYAHCTREVERGLFTDQHWIDLAPSLFADIYILRHPGYNVAYWNLEDREISETHDGRFAINGKPLVFFHFSGYSPNQPHLISKYYPQLRFSEISELYRLCFDDYRKRLLHHGYESTQHWPYAYAAFADGVPITDFLRKCLRTYDIAGKHWPDPYDTLAPNNFRKWATSPNALTAYTYVSPYALTCYQLRQDLIRAFPNVSTGDETGYATWFVQQTDSSPQFHPFYTEPIRKALEGSSAIQPVHEPKPIIPNSAHVGWKERWRKTTEFRKLYAAYVREHPIDFTLERPRDPSLPQHYVRLRRLLITNSLSRSALGILRDPLLRSTAYLLFESGKTTVSVPALPAIGPDNSAPTIELVSFIDQPGVNLFGYFEAATGVAEAARSLQKSLQAVSYPSEAFTIPITLPSLPLTEDEILSPKYGINVFNINADMTFPTMAYLGQNTYAERYNIGFWFWETSTFPVQWMDAFDVYDEIWVATTFVQDALASVSMKPVIRMPLAIDVPLSTGEMSPPLALSNESFLFLYIFDAASVIDRKNPYALIDAFQRAFCAQELAADVRLVMKVRNLEHFPEQEQRLRQAIESINGILITDDFDRTTINALINQCHAYVSLHRSEGYGLTMAEAMYLGKPVIATAYAGNMDFMNSSNSYLVPYRLIETDETVGAYPKGTVWADPDIDAAAEMLRYVYLHPDDAKERGARAAVDIRNNYNPVAVGKMIANRLNAIFARLTSVNGKPEFIRGGQ